LGAALQVPGNGSGQVANQTVSPPLTYLAGEPITFCWRQTDRKMLTSYSDQLRPPLQLFFRQNGITYARRTGGLGGRRD
jgi:hypothetical protein